VEPDSDDDDDFDLEEVEEPDCDSDDDGSNSDSDNGECYEKRRHDLPIYLPTMTRSTRKRTSVTF